MNAPASRSTVLLVWLALAVGGVITVAAPATAGAPQVQPRSGGPLAGLSPQETERFFLGRGSYSRLLGFADGLGPLFNATACSSCHNNPIGGAGGFLNIHFGIEEPDGGFDPLTDFGGTLLQQLSFGCDEIPPDESVTFLRITPGALGFGLIEAIPDDALHALEMNPPSVHVSGRRQLVRALEAPPDAPLRVGRFGWKAILPTVRSFSADAARNEMGLTNAVIPTEAAPNGDQEALKTCDLIDDPEDNPVLGGGAPFLDRVTDFQRFLAAPPQTPRSGMAGETLFASIGCADCHVPTFVTADDPGLEAAIRAKTIHPYADFLVHDMGELADFPQEGASASEFRTTTLWGLRRRATMLHDGRVKASTFAGRIEDAVFWHDTRGSEGSVSAAAFFALSGRERDEVIAFLNSLGRREFDHDGDGDVDTSDLGGFGECYGFGGFSPDHPCSVSDLDQDSDIDVDDLAGFVTVFNEAQPDCNDNGIGDLDDIAAGTSTDADFDLIPDECGKMTGDIDGDGRVDFVDLLILIAAWGPCPPEPCPADLDVSGDVEFVDLLTLLAAWTG